MFSRIAIIGAGAMGTLLGACLAKAGYPIDLIDVNESHIHALNTNGASVIGKSSFKIPVHAYTPSQLSGKYDLVFLLIKQVYNENAFAQLRDHLASDGVVVTLQNGFPEPAVASVFGADRTMGCAVTWAATFHGNGVTEAISDPEMWHNNLGRLDGQLTKKGYEIQCLLSSMCDTTLSNNLIGIRWSKLIINCSFSGMSAALGCTFGQVLDNPAALCCAQHIARECIRTAKAYGIKLEPIGSEGRLDLLMDFNTPAEREATNWIYQKLMGSCYSGKASMLQDLERHQRTEIHAINGVLSKHGRQIGIPTSVCDQVIKVVSNIEAGLCKPELDNLKYFLPLLDL